MRRIPAPLLLAYAASAVGVMGVVSALTPELADRIDLIKGVLPSGVPEAARTLALAFGLGLLWLARGLARRKRRAWQLAVALVVGSAVTHLAKGLDFEESFGALLLLAALWRTRREFVAPGDPAAVRPLAQVGAALALLTPIVVIRSYDGTAPSDRIEDALLIIIGALAARALFLWLRPVAGDLRGSDESRRAEVLVQEHGRDSLAYFALREDKCMFFSSSGRSFLAYRVVGGTAVVAGDPIGAPEELAELVAEFRRVASAKAWRVAIAGASAETLRVYHELGFKSVYLGDEAVVRPAAFSLEGRPIRKVRQSAARLAKAGYRVEVLRPCELDEATRADLCAVSAAWRGRWPERGFTMAMDGIFAYADAPLAVAFDVEGNVGGFLQLVPSPASAGYSLASMRRRRDTPNGLMEFLIVETIAWARSESVAEISLNFSVFGEYLNAEAGLMRMVLLRLDRLFQLERLHSFNRKFFPEWRRRYFCFERWTDFPLAGIAYLHAESLLTPPGPWVKSPDLAAR